MATTQIKIEAQVSQALKAIEDLKRSLGGIESSAASVNRSMAGMQRSTDLAATAFGALAAAISVKEIVGLADAATLVNNKLTSVSPNAQVAAQAFQAVGRIAQTTGQNFEAVGDLYQKVALQSQSLGLSQQEVARVTENFSKALVTTGTTGQAAASAIYQFGQSLGRGKVAYEDIRQLQEASSATVALIGKQFGMSGQQFVKAVQDGKISSEQLALAVNALGGEVNPTFEKMNKTVGQSMENIRTSFILMLNNFEKSTGTFNSVAKILDVVAKNIDTVTIAAAAFMAVFAAQKIIQMAVAFRTLNTVMKANPLILIASVAAGLAATIYEMVGASEDLNDATGDVLEKETAIRGVLDTRKGIAQELTKEQENAVKSLEQTISGLLNQAQYQRDILTLGVQEAEIRKKIADENDKLKKVGLELNTQQTERIRLALEEEASAKRRATIDRERSTDALQALTAENNFRKTILETLARQAAIEEGLTKEQTDERIRKMVGSEIDANKQILSENRRRINEVVDAEIGKYNQLYTLDRQYRKDQQVLQDIFDAQDLGAIKLTEARYAELKQAELRLEQEYEAQKIELRKRSAERQMQIEMDRINATLMAERNATAVVISERDRETLQKAGQQERQRAIVAERIAFEKKSEMEKIQFGIDQGAQMFSALGAQNKKAFEAAKAFNIANAIMNTYMAATKALATYPFPFGAVAAAAAVGMGLAQVAQIRSQTYSGRALGGPVMGGTPYLVGESGPEMFVPNTTGSITRNGDLGGGAPVNVTFNIQANDTSGFDDLLLSRKGLIRSVISDAMLESGRRG